MEIQLKDLEKRYERPVLKNITCTLEAGKLYVIKGVSGCGKSTLLNILGGIEREFSGSIEPVGFPQNWRAACLFQSSLLLAKLTVEENLRLISGDEGIIHRLCAQLGVDSLLGKSPQELSEGERQRIAIVRALLQPSPLLLADEPTASLDECNSRSIAQILAGLRSPDRILVVATHEDYFDAYADEILLLDYGQLRSYPGPGAAASQAVIAAMAPERRPGRRLFAVAWKRNPGLLKLGSLLPLLLTFLLVMMVSAVQNNFSQEYTRFLATRYPMDLICGDRDLLQQFSGWDALIRYEHYTFTREDIHGYYLPEKADSVFCVEGMLSQGRYPGTVSEILVSPEFVRNYLATGNDPQILGKTITLGGHSFSISGVTADLDRPFAQELLFQDVYYRRSIQENPVFIPYEALKVIGQPQEKEFLMASYRDLLSDPQALEELKDLFFGEVPCPFHYQIAQAQAGVDAVSRIFRIVLLVCFVCGCVFLVAMIQTTLFSRKRELGYLQIFGLSRARVTWMLLSEHILKLAAGLAGATVGYGAMLLMYWGLTGRWLFFHFGHTSQLIAGLFLVYLLTAAAAIAEFLQKSILSLVQ